MSDTLTLTNSSACTCDNSRVSTLKVYTDVNRYGHTEVITDIETLLPNKPVWDELEVKVDGGTESNILPQSVHHCLFPQLLTDEGLPTPGTL